MADCKEILVKHGSTVRCIATALPGSDYCAIHRRCTYCQMHHPDKTTYVCATCGFSSCVSQALLQTEKVDGHAVFVRRHQTRSATYSGTTFCGPMYPKTETEAA